MDDKPEILEQEPLTAEQICEGLKSSDPEERTRALCQLFPKGGNGAILFDVGELMSQVTWTPECDVRKAFNVLLQVCCQFGQAMGLELNWIQKQQPNGGIIAPPGFRG